MQKLTPEEDVPINHGSVYVFEVAVAINDVGAYLEGGGDVLRAVEYLNYLSDRLHAVAVLVE